VLDHDDVVARISAEYEKRGFQVHSRRNNLPSGSKRNEAIYRPDLLVKDSGGQIVRIVEVETSDAGKAVVGAAVLADVCMGIEMENGRQKRKPTLVFIFYLKSANLELGKKRLEHLTRQNRIRHLADVLLTTEN